MLRPLSTATLLIALLLAPGVHAEEVSSEAAPQHFVTGAVAFPSGLGFEYEYRLIPQLAVGGNLSLLPLPSMFAGAVGVNLRVFFADFGAAAFYLEPSIHQTFSNAAGDLKWFLPPAVQGAIGLQYVYPGGMTLSLVGGVFVLNLGGSPSFAIPMARIQVGHAF